MKVQVLSITLEEFQRAMRDYAEQHAKSQVEIVVVESYEKAKIIVELYPGGLVEAETFKHRTKHDG